MGRNFSSQAVATTLSGAMTNVQTTITLTSATGLPTSYPFTLVIEPSSASAEILTVTSLSSGTTYNCTRGQDGTTGVAHSPGVAVAHMVTGRDMQEVQNMLDSSGRWTFKAPCIAATTANLTLTAPGATIDGVTLAVGDRVLVKNQTAPAENGIYTFQGSAATMTRAPAADTSPEIAAAMVSVLSGTTNGGTTFENDFKSTDTLGTTAMPWSSVADTSTAQTLSSKTLTGAVIATAAGTTSTAPLRFTSGTNLSAVQSGAIEFDGDTFYGTPDSAGTGGRGVLPATHYYCLSAARALTSVNTAQSIFGVGLTLAGTTTYDLEMEFAVTTTGATSNSLGISFGGTATLTSIGYTVSATQNATSAATLSTPSIAQIAVATNVTITTAVATATYRVVRVRGIVRCNASGTFIPQLTYSAAPGAAPSVVVNSFIKMIPIGTNTVTTVGAWA